MNIKRFYPEDEQEVREYKNDHPGCIVALAYEACFDMDCVLIFENMADYESYKTEKFKSVYSGWITLDHNFAKDMNYRLHFTDDYGQGAIDVEEYRDAVDLETVMREDIEHCAWDFWIENLNGEEW